MGLMLTETAAWTGVRCFMTECDSSTGVFLTSEGPAAECCGSSLGQFLLLPELHEGAACYRQRHTVPGAVKYLYR